MLCDEVTTLLPGMVDGDLGVDRDAAHPHRDVPAVPGRARALPPAAAHARAAAHPLRRADARACSARPSPRSTDAAEEGARRTLLSGRRLAYAGAIGGTAVATAATAALLIARSRRRSLRLAG